MVLVKKWPFFHFFILSNISEEIVLYDILERKNVFLSYKNKKFKKSKKWHFSKEVNLRFCSKSGNFSHCLFLGNTGQENLFYDILQRKNVSLSYKNKFLTSGKIDIFPKGLTQGFGPKMAIFATLFF